MRENRRKERRGEEGQIHFPYKRVPSFEKREGTVSTWKSGNGIMGRRKKRIIEQNTLGGRVVYRGTSDYGEQERKK